MAGGTGAVVAWIIFLIVLLVIFIVALAIATTVFWILMIIDCAKREFKSDTEKVVWILLLIFLGILGAIIYYFAVKREADRSRRQISHDEAKRRGKQ